VEEVREKLSIRGSSTVSMKDSMSLEVSELSL